MKVRLKEDCCKKFMITKGRLYDVHTDSRDKYFIFDDNGGRYYFPLHDFESVPEVKESDIPSLEAMNQKSKVGTSKILGYECPMDLYGGFIKKGDILTMCANKLMYQSLNSNNVNAHGKMDISHLLLPAEIVETWEPIYKEDIYVGGEKVELNIDKDFACIHGIWITKEDLELLRDIPRETYDKIIQKLGVVENQES